MIQNRGPNVWRIMIYDVNNRQANGKPKRVTKTFKGSKKEAKILEGEMIKQLKNNNIINTSITFKEFSDKWLEDYAIALAPRTYNEYVKLLAKINLHIGTIKLSEINVGHLAKYYATLRKNGKKEPENKKVKNNKFMPLSENTILHHYTLIGNILNKAVEWEYISKNPNNKIEKPRLRKHIPKYYNIEQLEKFKKALEKENLKTRALLTLAIDSGARRGELTGLDWDDIDFTNCTININKTTQTVNGKIIEKSPKTDSSIRIVPITKKTIELLKLYREEQLEAEKLLGKKWTKTRKVFTSAFGGPMSPRMPSDILERVLEKNDLPKICFHELRHTSVSLLINSGIDAQIVSKRVGHSSVSTTTNIYSHIFQSTELKAVKAMTEILK